MLVGKLAFSFQCCSTCAAPQNVTSLLALFPLFSFSHYLLLEGANGDGCRADGMRALFDSIQRVGSFRQQG